MKTFIQKFLIKSDYFSKPVGMKFNKEATLGTMLGGLSSISIYLLCLTFMIKIGLEIVNKSEPHSTMINKYQPVPDMINLKNESLFYAFFFLSASYEKLDDPTLFNMELVRYNKEKNNISTLPIDTKKCSEYEKYYDD